MIAQTGAESRPMTIHRLLDRWGAPRTMHNPYTGGEDVLNIAGRLTWMLNPDNTEGWDWESKAAARNAARRRRL